jgi:hypothetical protein
LETWPTEGNEARILDLWIADKGRLGKSAGPWPLLNEGSVDVFTGVPNGRTQRGQVIHGLFFEETGKNRERPGMAGSPDPCRRAGSWAAVVAVLGSARMGAMPDDRAWESAPPTVYHRGEGAG